MEVWGLCRLSSINLLMRANFSDFFSIRLGALVILNGADMVWEAKRKDIYMTYNIF